MSTPVRLRGHHLLCLLTYRGTGYSPAFVEGMDRIAAALTAGADIVLVRGADDICAPLCTGDGVPHCFEASPADRDVKALASLSRLFGHALEPGDRLRLDAGKVAGMRKAFADGTVRAACGGCEWSGLCDEISAAGYAGAHLFPGAI